MPVHYELAPRPGAEHVALITLDRPEAKNACDLEHFHQLAQAWKRFSSDDAAWVAIFTGVERSFMSGPTSRLTCRRSPRCRKDPGRRGDDRRRIFTVRRHRCRAARQQDRQADHRGDQRPLRCRWDGDVGWHRHSDC